MVWKIAFKTKFLPPYWYMYCELSILLNRKVISYTEYTLHIETKRFRFCYFNYHGNWSRSFLFTLFILLRFIFITCWCLLVCHTRDINWHVWVYWWQDIHVIQFCMRVRAQYTNMSTYTSIVIEPSIYTESILDMACINTSQGYTTTHNSYGFCY